MNKKWFFVFPILVLFLSIQACTPTQSTPDTLVVTVVVKVTATPKPEPTIPTYSVTKSTGLYDALNVSANVIADLSTGSKLIPANGAKYLHCSSFFDAGVKYELCEVEVVRTGQTGWVLKKWFSRD